MNLIKRLDQYREENIYFLKPIKNVVMNEGMFIRIVDSNEGFVLNGIYLELEIHCHAMERHYNKCKCMFDPHSHKALIDKIRDMERGLLKKYPLVGKIPQPKIAEQLQEGHLKIFAEGAGSSSRFLLKIAGIWETETEYGLTFKFFQLCHFS